MGAESTADMGELSRLEALLWRRDGVDGVCEGALETRLPVCELSELLVDSANPEVLDPKPDAVVIWER